MFLATLKNSYAMGSSTNKNAVKNKMRKLHSRYKFYISPPPLSKQDPLD